MSKFKREYILALSYDVSQDLSLAHDVSGEARDDHGRWANSGGGGSGNSGKSVKSKEKKSRYKRFKDWKAKNNNKAFDEQVKKERDELTAYTKTDKYKKRAKLRTAAKTVYAAGLAGVAAKVGGQFFNDPTVKQAFGGVTPKITGKHIAIATAVGATIGYGSSKYNQAKEKNPEFEKKANKAERVASLATFGISGAHLAVTKYRSKLPKKVHTRMMEKILERSGRADAKKVAKDYVGTPIVQSLFREKLVREAALKKDTVLLKMLHTERKFASSPLSNQIKIAKAIRRHVGVKSLGEHIAHIASKVVRKFKPLKVVRLAGMLT